MILIATPYYNPITPETVESVSRVLSAFPGARWEKRFGAMIDANRHACVTDKIEVRQHLPKDITHVLFWDSDIYHPDAAGYIKRMIRQSKPVITGMYRGRYSESAAGYWEDGRPGISKSIIEFNSTGVQKVDWTGAGFLLCKTSALEKLPFPWFRYPVIRPTAEHADNAGEDIGFCLNCRDNNIQIWIDCDSKMHHKPNVSKEGGMTDQKKDTQTQEMAWAPGKSYTIASDSLSRMAGEAMRVQKMLDELFKHVAQLDSEKEALAAEVEALKKLLAKTVRVSKNNG